MSDLVWYAAYGSNLWRERFETYLTGGPVPFSPTGRHQRGSSDPSPPRAVSQIRLERTMILAGQSSSWAGGGTAYLNPEPPDHSGRPWNDTEAGPTLCRLWLITSDQFLDVLAQENGTQRDHVAHFDFGRFCQNSKLGDPKGRYLDVLPRSYGRVVDLGAGPDNYPMITFTAPDFDRRPFNPAHPTYLRAMGLGLIQGWDLSPSEAARHLAAKPGNRGHIDAEVLAADLTRHRKR